MTLSDDITNILSAIVEKVKSVIEATYIGDRGVIKQYPVALVKPEGVAMRPLGPNRTAYEYSFSIDVGEKGNTYEAALKSVITVAQNVQEVLATDRHLSNTADGLEVDEISFVFEPYETFLICYARLSVRVLKYVVP